VVRVDDAIRWPWVARVLRDIISDRKAGAAGLINRRPAKAEDCVGAAGLEMSRPRNQIFCCTLPTTEMSDESALAGWREPSLVIIA